jgi:HAD superfamily hydrolase (TIGR01509 family)
MAISSVIFDLDGVILDSEEAWHAARAAFSKRYGGDWTEEDQRAVMGADSWQWAHHIRERFAVPLPETEIIAGVVALMRERYEREVPLLEGAREAVHGLARAYRLGLASSSPPELIGWVLHATGLAGVFSAWVSSDDVGVGKPAPDVYLEACDRLGVACGHAAAIEDSTNGLRAARHAGLAVVAVPNPRFPPAPDALALADVVLQSITQLTVRVVADLRCEPS